MAIPHEQPAPNELILMNVVETCRFFGGANSPLNPATLYRGIKTEKYPAPIKLGPGTSRWVKSECEQMLRDLIAARSQANAAT